MKDRADSCAKTDREFYKEGLVALSNNDYDEAIRLFNTAFKQSPGKWIVYEKLGKAYFFRWRHNEIMNLFKSLIDNIEIHDEKQKN
jgi:tetratricopeptide (TPR) repeat protein